MLATYINCLSIIVGSLIGILLKQHLGENFKHIILTASGLVTLVLGMQMALQSDNILVLILSLIVGGLIGYLLKLDAGLNKLGDKLGSKTSKGGEKSTFTKGFVSASLLFCMGAMSIVGSIQAGTTGEYQTILIKSVMDGCMAIVFSSAYGIGVLFSSLFVLIYQGFFTLAGSWIGNLVHDAGIVEMSAAGGIMLLMIGLDLLDLKKIKTANYLPALIFAPIFLKLLSFVQN